MKNIIIAMRSGDFDLENDGQYWSEADKRMLIDFFNEGIGITKMALEMGRSEPAIVQQLVKERMFEHETQTRRSRERSCICRCPQCEDYKTCPRSPVNARGTACPMEGGSVEDA